MNLDDIADLAEKAGCDVSALDGREYQTMWCDSDQLQKLVALVEAETIERCAVLCETVRRNYVGYQCAEAIRSWK